MTSVRRPEVLAPAGDAECLQVALQAGADAVYFGLDAGFNARARATNFSLEALPDTVQAIHQAGARAYLTANTLIFQSELTAVERLLRAAIRAGVDALIVQDPAVALLARALSDEIEIHASTQMTISSAEAARFAETLGITRVVVPRELSVREIRTLAQGTSLELEVFIMGALCVSWSGQCLSSEAWGGRSANRGQCAQACRLPYDLVVDGAARPLGDVSYLLSPRDLAGFRAISDLMDIGVHTLKIEGRQKGATYVHTATDSVRRWVDAVARGYTPSDVQHLAGDMRNLSLAYSRGFGDGFLAGSDHQTLVEGRFPRHRGLCLGRVANIDASRVYVEPLREAPRPARGEVSSPLPSLGGSTGPPVAPLVPLAGMGVMFDEGRPQEEEQGGPIFSVQRSGEQWVLGFGTPGPDLRRVRTGARVWVTSDPALQAQVQRQLKAPPPRGRIALRLQARGSLGQPLRITAHALGRSVTADSGEPLQQARGRGLDESTLHAKLGAFGDTPFHVESMDTSALADDLFLPPSALKEMRRRLQADLSAVCWTADRPVAADAQVPRLLAEARARHAAPQPPLAAPRLVPLCRTDEQLEAAIACRMPEVVLDWMEMVGLERAVRRAREAGLEVGVATLRVQKPGEESYDRRIQHLRPDSVLVRHWAGVMHFSTQPQNRPHVHGDFSLNVTNALTAYHLFGLGLETVTVAHDTDERQLMELLREVPANRMAVTVHHHIPTFHTEHCVYSNLLSEGRDYRSCGRPCERHQVSLRDRVGNEHPVIVDVGCRNTVFNAAAQTAASLVPQLLERGVRLLRMEFVRETREQAEAVLQAYQGLIERRLSVADAVARVGAHEQFGVTRGTMQVLKDSGG